MSGGIVGWRGRWRRPVSGRLAERGWYRACRSRRVSVDVRCVLRQDGCHQSGFACHSVQESGDGQAYCRR
nr:MAG TPA: hypothetical protein [Caudoviricetes sp.]